MLEDDQHKEHRNHLNIKNQTNFFSFVRADGCKIKGAQDGALRNLSCQEDTAMTNYVVEEESMTRCLPAEWLCDTNISPYADDALMFTHIQIEWHLVYIDKILDEDKDLLKSLSCLFLSSSRSKVWASLNLRCVWDKISHASDYLHLQVFKYNPSLYYVTQVPEFTENVS